MNRTMTPLKIVTPKNKRFGSFHDMDYYTLDINGRSYSPQNLQDIITPEVESMSQTMGSIYESKKFKIRTASNFVKTTRNWKNLPYQRIRKVQNAINHEKQVQKLTRSQKSPTILPQFDTVSPSLSPKTTENPFRQKDHLEMHKKVQTLRLKQIQQLIKSSRQQSKQKRNIIRFEQKINSLEANQVILLGGSEIEGHQTKRERYQVLPINKASIYADMVKNRKKLNEKRQTKKKMNDHSLLGRINYLQHHQQVNFVLRNSFDRSKLNQNT